MYMIYAKFHAKMDGAQVIEQVVEISALNDMEAIEKAARRIQSMEIEDKEIIDLRVMKSIAEFLK